MKYTLRNLGLKYLSIITLLSGMLLYGCNDQPSSVSRPDTQTTVPAAGAQKTTAIPAQGTASTLDFANWNLEWFGDTQNGPGNESMQLDNVQTVMSGLDMDLWAVEEVTSVPQFNDLLSQLPGYDGFLANDSLVTDGAAYYSDFNNNELKVGLIYKTSLITVHSARVILKNYDYEFAGRPPVEVQLTATVNGVSEDLVVILLHAKAGSATSDWDRRNTASAALKSYLDSTWPAAKVMVLGDFNDDVDVSITSSKPSPYKNFVDDAADYTIETKVLSDAGETSTVNYSDMIDHQLSTNELIADYQDNTVQVFPADQYIANYGQTTSDHYPVLSSYTVPGGSGSTNTPPTASFTFSCTDLNCSFDGSGSTDSDGTITGYSWNFGDGNTATGATVSHSYASGGTYTVTLTVTDDGSLTDSSSQSASVSSSGSGSGQVYINEFEQNPAGSDFGNEWVELYNSGSSAVDVTGWVLTANGGNPQSKTLSGSIPAGGYMVVSKSGQFLDNSGESLTLDDDTGTQVDATPVFDDGANDSRSQQRSIDGADTWTFKTNTKGASNG